jgi:hypothetical protein
MESGFSIVFVGLSPLLFCLVFMIPFSFIAYEPLAVDAMTEGKWSHKSWNRLPVHARPRYKRYSASTLSTSMCTQSPR